MINRFKIYNICFDKNYKLYRKESLKYANSVIKREKKDVIKNFNSIIGATISQYCTTILMGSMSYIIENPLFLGLSVLNGVLSVYTTMLFVPEIKLNVNQLKRIKKKRDIIFNEQMSLYTDSKSKKIK